VQKKKSWNGLFGGVVVRGVFDQIGAFNSIERAVALIYTDVFQMDVPVPATESLPCHDCSHRDEVGD
jgi:hypothetical protein